MGAHVIGTVGSKAKANGITSAAFGSSATANADNTLALGTSSKATQTNGMAFGVNANSTGFGSIAVGKNADLVVVKGDPSTHIDDIENTEIVFKDGVGYDSQKLLDSVRGRYGQY